MELKMTKEQAESIYELGMKTGDCIGFVGMKIAQKEDHIEVIEKFLNFSMEIGVAFRPEGFWYYKSLIRPNGVYVTKHSIDAEDEEFLKMQREYDEKQSEVSKAQQENIKEALEMFPDPGKPTVINIELDDEEKKVLDDL